KPIVMRMVQNHHTMNWDRYKKLLEDCSPIVDCGVHYVDVMQWFTKAKVVSVSGMGARLDYDIDEKNYNYGMIQAKLSDGSIAYYEAGWSNSTASENVKEFIGPKGRIKLVLSAERSTHKEEGDLIEYYETATQTYYTINMASKYKSTFHQLMTLIDMVEKNADGNPTIEDVLSVVKVVFAADKAIKEGKTINLDEETQEIIK
ncbi:MAG: Gfo/Idh/MocA family oxidoreductase, partial [Oscillospiraceae bacterium]